MIAIHLRLFAISFSKPRLGVSRLQVYYICLCPAATPLAKDTTRDILITLLAKTAWVGSNVLASFEPLCFHVGC